MIIITVGIMADMPPRFIKAIKVALWLLVLKPLTNKSAQAVKLCCVTKAILETKILIIKAGIAGIFCQAVMTNKPSGTIAHQVGASSGNKRLILAVASPLV